MWQELSARVGQARTFQIPIDMFMQAEPLLIIAECKWVEIKGRHKKYPVAGFEIMDLPEKDRKIRSEISSSSYCLANQVNGRRSGEKMTGTQEVAGIRHVWVPTRSVRILDMH